MTQESTLNWTFLRYILFIFSLCVSVDQLPQWSTTVSQKKSIEIQDDGEWEKKNEQQMRRRKFHNVSLPENIKLYTFQCKKEWNEILNLLHHTKLTCKINKFFFLKILCESLILRTTLCFFISLCKLKKKKVGFIPCVLVLNEVK
jgi:hypothetical protein